ncbi:MAG: hypothetical protein R3F56_01640 [Planctomycetota bacterium]
MLASRYTALLLTTAATAQAIPYAGPVEHVLWHSSPSSPNFTQVATGMLSGAGYPDIAVLENGVPSLYMSPGTVNHTAPIAGAPAGCSALVTRPFQTAYSGYHRDELIVACGFGLKRWRRTGAPTWETLDATFAGVPWKGAKRLLSADVNGDGICDLIALSSRGDAVGVRLGTSTGFGANYIRWLPGPVGLDIVSTPWDINESDREVAVAMSSGLVVFDHLLQNTLASIAGTDCSKALLASPRSNITGNGEILVLAAEKNSAWKLFSVDSQNPAGIDLGALGLVGCAVGDVDADGDDDLAFSKTANHRTLVLFQDGDNHFTGVGLDVPLIGSIANWEASSGAAPANRAWPALVDVDSNGAAEVVQAVESQNDVILVRSPLGAGRAVTILGSGSLTGSDGSFHINLDIQTTPPAGATDIEWVVSGILLGPASNRTYDMGIWSGSGRVSIGATQVSIAAPESELLIDQGLSLLIQLRPLQVNGGVVVRAFRPTMCIFAIDQWESYDPPMTMDRYDAEYLEQMFDALGRSYTDFAVNRDGEPSQAGNGGANGVGLGVGAAPAGVEPTPGKGSSRGGGIGPATNGGVNTGIIIVIDPPPPPDPPGSGTTGPG